MGNEWDTSLLSCFSNCGVCLLAHFLPFVVFGQNAEDAGTCSCFIAFLLFFVPPIDLYILAKTRTDTREKHNIDGSFCGDLMASFCCPCCVMIQTKNQLNLGVARMGEEIERV